MSVSHFSSKSADHGHSSLRTLVDDLMDEQRSLPAADTFSRWHTRHTDTAVKRYTALLPATAPGPGQQYAFEVNLDACTGCKACVAACHSLNGLGESETWRSAGTMVTDNPRNPARQTITTACHHCEDPACASGCPTLAYEKDAATGIVRHLDDQCIGCSYCTMTCPYEVPQYQPAHGIVRKCDMCRQRLDAGEAPACVQACPTSAIRIVLIERGTFSPADRLLPGAPPSEITRPATRYVSASPVHPELAPDNAAELTPQHAHAPLAAMLVLTQWGTGGILAALVATLMERPAFPLLLTSVIILHAGLAASVFHLGQPLKAWRAWLGWRKSWLSREIIALGACSGCSAAAVAAQWLVLPRWLCLAALSTAAATGIAGVFTSGMVYHATRRQVWRGTRSLGRFYLSAVLGAAVLAWCWQAAPAWLVIAAALVKLSAELRWARCDTPHLADDARPGASTESAWIQARHHRLLNGPLGLAWRLRLTLGFLAGVILPAWLMLSGINPPAAGITAAVLLLGCDLLERLLFFCASVSWRMPGWNT